jgi:hypothetical protein
MTAAPPINDDIVESGSANEAEKRAVPDGSPGGQAQMPLPSVRDIFQGGLFVLATLAALYAARQIALPIVLAATLKLLMQPALRTLQRFHVPGALGALLLIGLLFCTLIAFGTALSGPANSWAQKLPQGVPRLQEHLSFLRGPIEAAQQFLQRAEDWFSGGQPSGGSSKGSSIGSSLLGSVFAGTTDEPRIQQRQSDGGANAPAGDAPVKSATEARQGVTGHNVRYVLAFGVLAIIVAFAVIYGYYFHA